MNINQPKNSHRVFHNHLWDFGLYGENGPRSWLKNVVDPETGALIAYWNQPDPIGNHGQNGHLSIRGIGDLIAPKYCFHFEAVSEILDDSMADPSEWNLTGVYRRVGGRIIPTRMFWGFGERHRKYNIARTDAAVRAGVPHVPWIRFRIGGQADLTIQLDEASITAYLVFAAQKTLTGSGEQKLHRNLVRFLYQCDADAFVEPIKYLASRSPNLLKAFPLLIPRKHQLADNHDGIGSTVAVIAREHCVSESTIRRAIRHLDLRPICRKPWYVYATNDCNRIAELLAIRQLSK